MHNDTKPRNPLRSSTMKHHRDNTLSMRGGAVCSDKRVREQRYRCSLHKELYVQVSPHTAQARLKYWQQYRASQPTQALRKRHIVGSSHRWDEGAELQHGSFFQASPRRTSNTGLRQPHLAEVGALSGRGKVRTPMQAITTCRSLSPRSHTRSPSSFPHGSPAAGSML
jgi:hypothetical protein